MDDVVDHTVDPDQQIMDEDEDGGGDAGEQRKIRLKSGINIRELLQQQHGAQGIMLEPEIDPEPELTTRDKSYFAMDDREDIGDKLRRLNIDETADDDEDDDDSFEAKAAKMTSVTKDGKVKKRLLFGGLTTEGPPPDKATVTIHFSLYLESNDEPFDSSVLRGRAERFRLDDGRMIVGMELAVKTMKKRERAEFIIGWEYGFGEMGCPPRVPAKADILAK